MAKAKTAYWGFLALWKDARPDFPILKQAKRNMGSCGSCASIGISEMDLPMAAPTLLLEKLKKLFAHTIPLDKGRR